MKLIKKTFSIICFATIIVNLFACTVNMTIEKNGNLENFSKEDLIKQLNNNIDAVQLFLKRLAVNFFVNIPWIILILTAILIVLVICAIVTAIFSKKDEKKIKSEKEELKVVSAVDEKSSDDKVPIDKAINDNVSPSNAEKIEFENIPKNIKNDESLVKYYDISELEKILADTPKNEKVSKESLNNNVKSKKLNDSEKFEKVKDVVDDVITDDTNTEDGMDDVDIEIYQK